jgi:hypothetical protein
MTASIPRAVRGLPAAALVGAAAVTLPAAPAHAAACSPGVGVTVVVEFGALGGGNPVACDPGGAGDAADDVTERVGFALDPVASQPGFVCRVDGKPASDPCQRTPPQNAYWGLFWSDGKGGWKYSSTSAGSLEVPAGGSIGWRWQDGGGTDYPATAPNQGSAPEPEPKPEPQPGRQDKPEGGGSGGGGGQEQEPEAPTEPVPPATPTPDGSTTGDRREPSRPDKGKDAAGKDGKPKDAEGKDGKRSKRDAPTDSSSPATEDEPAEVTEALEPVSDDSDGGGGDPTMLLLGGGAVLVLASAAGVTAWRRRG